MYVYGFVSSTTSSSTLRNDADSIVIVLFEEFQFTLQTCAIALKNDSFHRLWYEVGSKKRIIWIRTMPRPQT
jgi:hypothetical protein